MVNTPQGQPGDPRHNAETVESEAVDPKVTREVESVRQEAVTVQVRVVTENGETPPERPADDIEDED